MMNSQSQKGSVSSMLVVETLPSSPVVQSKLPAELGSTVSVNNNSNSKSSELVQQLGPAVQAKVAMLERQILMPAAIAQDEPVATREKVNIS